MRHFHSAHNPAMLDLGVGILLEAGSAGTEVEKVVDAGSSR